MKWILQSKTIHKFMRFKDFILKEEDGLGMGGPPPMGGSAPGMPGGDMGAAGGMPPPPGGAMPGMPPGGGAPGMPGMPGAPGAPAGPAQAQIPVNMKPMDVWGTLEKLLGGKESSPSNKSPNMLQKPANKHLMS